MINRRGYPYMANASFKKNNTGAMRAIATLVVLFCHLSNTMTARVENPLLVLCSYGNVAVGLFFFYTGYNLLYNYMNRPGWAEDFFYSCFTPITVAVSSISALLSVAAAIRHPMRRIRMTIAMLIPIAVIAATLFMAYLATGGYFAVDVYIRGAAPGLALIPHAVPLCERTEK